MRPEVQVLLGPLCKVFGVSDFRCFQRAPVSARVRSEEKPVKKLLMFAAAAAVQYAIKRRKGKDSRDVWKQATR